MKQNHSFFCNVCSVSKILGQTLSIKQSLLMAMGQLFIYFFLFFFLLLSEFELSMLNCSR